MDWQAFGAALYAHRLQVGFPSLRDLGAQLGISAPTLSRVERGQACDVETFGALCRWAHLDANQWLGITGPRLVSLPDAERVEIAGELERLAGRLREVE